MTSHSSDNDLLEKSAVEAGSARGRFFAVLFLLGVNAALLAVAAVVDAPTIDEPLHLAGGLRRLLTGIFDIDRGNPPLPGTIAAIPVLLSDPSTDWSTASDPYAPLGSFLRANGPRSAWLILLGRWACIPFSLIGGYVCFCWASELFGFRSGLLALTLWCFCPNLLAHGHLITGDMAAASFGVATLYTFWKWLREPSPWQAGIAGLCWGLAEISKYVWVLLFVLLPVLWIVWRAIEAAQGVRMRWRRDLLQSALMLVLCLYVIHTAYGFGGCLPPMGDMKAGQRVLGWLDAAGIPSEWLTSIPLPFPRDYLRGIGDIDNLRAGGFCNFIAGRWREGGVWWFYPYSLLIKLPVGALVLVPLAAVLACARWKTVCWKSELLFWLSIVSLLLFVTFLGSQHTLRYALPFIPLAYVWLSKVAGDAVRNRAWLGLVTIALAASVLSSLQCYPHSLSYFNEIVGGPLRGHEHLLGGNFDWGQDLFYLRRWLDAHPEARPLPLAYHGVYSPQDAGVQTTSIPLATDDDGPVPGWYAVSANYLRGFSYAHKSGLGIDYEYFQTLPPATSAGYSILIYHLTLDDANEVRRRLGLPPCPSSPQP